MKLKEKICTRNVGEGEESNKDLGVPLLPSALIFQPYSNGWNTGKTSALLPKAGQAVLRTTLLIITAPSLSRYQTACSLHCFADICNGNSRSGLESL